MIGRYASSTIRSRRGFTLIELLVVIGIILLLVAITLTVGRGVVRQSEVRETQNTMRLLDVAVQEWETASDRQVLYGVDGEPCNFDERYELGQVDRAGNDITDVDPWGSDENAAFRDAEGTTDRMWALLRRTSTVREIMARINPTFLRELDPDAANATDLEHLEGIGLSFRVLDAWERPIIAVLPGRAHNWDCEGDEYTVDDRPDDDGTIRTPFENRFGVATDRRIFFVSAGPDGLFGALHLDAAAANLDPGQQDDITDAEDNVYSYSVQIDQARPSP